MSDFDMGAEGTQPDVQPLPAIQDDDVPARRLLAHDLEHLAWDHDGDDGAPPPD